MVLGKEVSNPRPVKAFANEYKYTNPAEVNPIPVKAAYNMIGFDAGVPRAPLTELEEHNKTILLNAIKNAGIKTYD